MEDLLDKKFELSCLTFLDKSNNQIKPTITKIQSKDVGLSEPDWLSYWNGSIKGRSNRQKKSNVNWQNWQIFLLGRNVKRLNSLFIQAIW